MKGKIKTTCLRCGNEFRTDSKYIRLCKNCKAYIKKRGSDSRFHLRNRYNIGSQFVNQILLRVELDNYYSFMKGLRSDNNYNY